MKIHTAKKQYTVRGISPQVDKALRALAHNRGISLNQVLVTSLQQVVGLNKKTNGLERYAGMIPYDPVVESALKDQRTVDLKD